MTVAIKPFNDELTERFQREAERIREVLGDEVSIEHVGSSAVGIGGKNIVDILVGVNDASRMAWARDALLQLGYREGHDTHDDRIFMAWRHDDSVRPADDETGEGDCHVHICVAGPGEYENMLCLRDYLRGHPDEAAAYEQIKHELAREAGYDRRTYKALKSGYVRELLERARKSR